MNRYSHQIRQLQLKTTQHRQSLTPPNPNSTQSPTLTRTHTQVLETKRSYIATTLFIFLPWLKHRKRHRLLPPSSQFLLLPKTCRGKQHSHRLHRQNKRLAWMLYDRNCNHCCSTSSRRLSSLISVGATFDNPCPPS